MTPDYMAYMLRYDTMHGQFDGTIEYTDDAIIVNGKTVKFFACMDPKDIPWGKVGAEYVVAVSYTHLKLRRQVVICQRLRQKIRSSFIFSR